MAELVVGVFPNRQKAEAAAEALKAQGFAAESMGYVASEPGELASSMQEKEQAAGGGAVTSGALAGGILGGAAGWLIALTAAVPGVGVAVAGGALVAALEGVALGVGAGSLIGALVGIGIPHEHAQHLHEQFRSGRALLTVLADGRAEEAASTMANHGAIEVQVQLEEGISPSERAAYASDSQQAPGVKPAATGQYPSQKRMP